MNIAQLRKARAKCLDDAKAIIATARSEQRDLTYSEGDVVGEVEQIEALKAEADDYSKQIERAEYSASLINTIDNQHGALAQVSNSTVTHRIEMGQDLAATDPKWGWNTFGEFMHAVKRSGEKDPNLDWRLTDRNPAIKAAATTYGNEAVGADGGFLVPPQFSASVREHMLNEEAILPLTDGMTVAGNSITFPRDETTPWGTDGIRAYWTNEGSAPTATKPVIGEDTLRTNKLMSLVPVSDELLADTSALGDYISRKMGRSMRWKLNESLMSGNGVGQPKGAFNDSGVYTSVSRTTASSVKAADVSAMFSRLPNAGSMGRAVWMMHHTVFPQIMTMSISNQPIWTPPIEGFKRAPAGLLLGRPIILSQHCAALGSAGDIRLCDWQEYVTIYKSANPEVATSMHLYFDADQTAYRSVFRIGGQPWQTAYVTPNSGTAYITPFVQLTT